MGKFKSAGFSLVEMTITLGLMGAGALFMMNMQENNMRMMATIEAKINRMEMKGIIQQQILSNPDNCKCLFENASPFNAPQAPPGVSLSGTMPTKLGRYFFPTPGSCAGATIPNPILEKDKVKDGHLVKDIRIDDVTGFDQLYSGNLTIDLESVKNTMGAKSFGFKIPISIETAPSGSGQKLIGCGEVVSSAPQISVDSADGVGQSITVPDGTRSFSFPGVSSAAKALMISYVIGASSEGRSDRNCTISGSGSSIVIGQDSKGDGGQRFIAGTAFVAYKPSMTMSCNNDNSKGSITVIGVLK